MVLFFLAFMVIGRLIPPIPPTWNAQQVTQFFIDHKMRIRVGITLSCLVVTIWYPFLGTLCVRVRRAEGRWGPLSITELFASGALLIAFWVPLLLLGVAAYRPESRPPEITHAINDMFWLVFIALVEVTVAQAIPLIILPFIDRNDPPTFPRWFGYFNAWYALLVSPGACVIIFNNGPLAWNGIFAFWIPAVIFGAWFIVTPVVIIRSLNAEQAAETQSP